MYVADVRYFCVEGTVLSLGGGWTTTSSPHLDSCVEILVPPEAVAVLVIGRAGPAAGMRSVFDNFGTVVVARVTQVRTSTVPDWRTWVDTFVPLALGRRAETDSMVRSPFRFVY
jgi:hypothetical protein